MRIILLFTLLTVASTSLSAQEGGRNQRRGFWFSLGVGPAAMGDDCSTCTGDPVYGASGNIRLGGTLSQRFLLGADIAGWAITAFNADQTIGAATLSLFWYPSPQGALYIKAGAGGMRYTHMNRNTNSETIDDAGVLTLGVGYEFRVGRNISFVPYLNAYASGDVSRTVNGAPVVPGPYTRNLVQFGIGITLH